MDFVNGLSIFINQRGKIYNFILIIMDRLIQMVYHKPVKVKIDALDLAKVIKFGLHNLIISNGGPVFTLKFLLLLYYFLDHKLKLFIIFYLQIDSSIKKEYNIIKAYFKLFSITNRMTRLGYCQGLNLLIVKQKMLGLAIVFMNSNMAFTLEFSIKETLTLILT